MRQARRVLQYEPVVGLQEGIKRAVAVRFFNFFLQSPRALPPGELIFFSSCLWLQRSGIKRMRLLLLLLL